MGINNLLGAAYDILSFTGSILSITVKGGKKLIFFGNDIRNFLGYKYDLIKQLLDNTAYEEGIKKLLNEMKNETDGKITIKYFLDIFFCYF